MDTFIQMYSPTNAVVETSEVLTPLHAAVLTQPVIKTMTRVSGTVHAVLAQTLSVAVLVIAHVNCNINGPINSEYLANIEKD